MDTTTKIANGTYTLLNSEKHSHVTIKIHTVRKGKLEGKRIISKLVGTDNENDYMGFGFVHDNDRITIWQSKKDAKLSQIAHILRSLLFEGDASIYSRRVTVELSKRCLRCNRKLTTPQSLKDGIGPECIKKPMF